VPARRAPAGSRRLAVNVTAAVLSLPLRPAPAPVASLPLTMPLPPALRDAAPGTYPATPFSYLGDATFGAGFHPAMRRGVVGVGGRRRWCSAA
jgi:hypothetical protein